MFPPIQRIRGYTGTWTERLFNGMICGFVLYPSVAKLPPELLVMILHTLYLDTPLQFQTLLVSRLSRVCIVWKSVIENNQVFWTSLKVEVSTVPRARRIAPYLQARLERWSMVPIGVIFRVAGKREHDEVCECTWEELCGTQAQIREAAFYLLNIIVGPQGAHIRRWTSFEFDLVTAWCKLGSNSAMAKRHWNFQGLFNHSAPLLERLVLRSVYTPSPLFLDAPRLHTVWLHESSVRRHPSLSTVRTLRLDYNSAGIDFTQCENVEVLVLKLGVEEDDIVYIPSGFAFKNLRKLILLGATPYGILEAVGERTLDLLCLRVSDVGYLQRVNQSLNLANAKKVVLGTFDLNDDHDSDDSEFGDEPRTAQYTRLVKRVRGLGNITLLGRSIDAELAKCGINVPKEISRWTPDENEDEIESEAPPNVKKVKFDPI